MLSGSASAAHSRALLEAGVYCDRSGMTARMFMEDWMALFDDTKLVAADNRKGVQSSGLRLAFVFSRTFCEHEGMPPAGAFVPIPRRGRTEPPLPYRRFDVPEGTWWNKLAPQQQKAWAGRIQRSITLSFLVAGSTS